MKLLNQITRFFFLIYFIILVSCSNSSNNTTYSSKPKIDHYSIVRGYADQVAEVYMQKICPNTGKNAYGIVNDYHYDSYHRRYEVDIEIYWNGKPWALAESRKYEIDGTLNVFSDRSWDFEYYYKNEAVSITIIRGCNP